MRQLLATIRTLVGEDKYIVGKHAAERLEERGIMEWQVVASVDDGELIVERPEASPNPAVEAVRLYPTGRNSKPAGPTCGKGASRSWLRFISLTRIDDAHSRSTHETHSVGPN